MNRTEIISQFREENPEITLRVISDSVLASWLKTGDKDVCAKTRCIVDQDGTTIETSEDDESYDLTSYISRFFDVDDFPGGGVTYNDKRLNMTTIAELDMEASNWRGREAGTPQKWYRRGKWLYLDRPIDSNEEDLKVYAVLIPSDFDSDSKTPFNQLTYLEPYHPILVRYLKWRAKEKIGKRQDAINARAEYITEIQDMKKTLGGGKFGKIYFRKRETS